MKTAESYVCGPREETYGSPTENFARIARLWSTYLNTDIAPTDVACMMMLLKMSRLRATPNHNDSWIDIAGYAACGSEISDSQV